MGAILANGAHPHFIVFYRILSKDKRTHKQTHFCKGHSTIASTQRTYVQFLKETVESETQFIRAL